MPSATKLAASCAQRAVAKAPMMRAKAPVQGMLGTGGAPRGVELETAASAPATAPNMNGAMRLAAPNSRLSMARARAGVPGLARRPSAALRSTIASSAIVSGASSAVPRAEKAAGKAEKRIVIEKISQTWLASQTGPIVAAIAWRSASRLPASRSRMPAPKSAPANRA